MCNKFDDNYLAYNKYASKKTSSGRKSLKSFRHNFISL